MLLLAFKPDANVAVVLPGDDLQEVRGSGMATEDAPQLVWGERVTPPVVPLSPSCPMAPAPASRTAAMQLRASVGFLPIRSGATVLRL